MKNKFLVYVIAVLTSGPLSARVLGPSTGGGGFIVTCPATQVSPEVTELLDIYEGRVLGFQMKEASGDLKQDYFESVKRTYELQGHPNLADTLKTEIVQNLIATMQSVKFVSDPRDLPVAQDLGETPWIPSQCQIRQLAYFEDQSIVISVYKPLWDKMDSLSKAALVQHELWFRTGRLAGERTSENSRRSVAQIFSLSGLVPLKEGLPSWASEFSVSVENNFRITNFAAANYMGGLHGQLTRLQFDQVNGLSQLSKTWADFPKMQWSFKLGRSKDQPEVVDCILQTPDVHVEHSAFLQGVAVKGYSAKLSLKTGEPVKLTIVKDGVVMSQGFVGGGINCSSVLN